MKILIDKVSAKPLHGISEAELQKVIEALPPEWIAEISTIRLSNSIDPVKETYYSRYKHLLTVYSRGRKRQNIIRAIFKELAAHSLGFRNISDVRARRINHIIDPPVEKLLATFPRPKPNPVYPRTLNFRVASIKRTTLSP